MTRKIEKAMNKAIADGKDWKKDNTEVYTHLSVAYVLLYGNKIAEVGDGWIRLFDGGWQTATTKGRLNAILEENGLAGESVFQKAGKWFFRFSDGATIPFFNGMRIN
jgi:hypothetical protein